MPPSCYSTTPDLIDIDDAFDKSMVQSEKEIKPHENDILMGRGGKNNQHIGNEKLRGLARVQSENYRVASKKGKSSISRELVKQVRSMKPPGRFLKKDSETGVWEDVGDDIAREKTSQVLRDAVSILLGRSSCSVCVEEVDHATADTSRDIPRSVSAQHFSNMRQDMKCRSWEEMKCSTPPQNISSKGFYSSQSFHPHTEPPSKRTRYHIYPSDRSGTPSTYHPSHRSICHPDQTTPIVSSQPHYQPRHIEKAHHAKGVPCLTGPFQKYAALDEFDLFNGELLNSDVETDNEEKEDDDGDNELKQGFWPVCV
mmetsp:Transcript_27744/g.41983  ORF Transcript_27744/g.41983 Transcript_27744/m.41983 type:complete len:312 (-) Transcript_27744:388-1323(-)|eukprot:CAMPEP_0178938668 /NCGR_PEP_ID=MMETSP0786-20121207/26458_1 /TAXON_ID=186022 /ORGANISM="Thalassionema frauenfeldii, Strain CCMP 1798" /LENGTH=311 /DNA_ID=CAMNT_0020617411 /DNA_START=606 /DNA_END=1541 /DNA_ORIENTATION=+